MNNPSLIVLPEQKQIKESINKNKFIDFISSLIIKGYDNVKQYLYVIIILVIVYTKREKIMNQKLGEDTDDEKETEVRVLKKSPDEDNDFEDIDSIIEEYNRQERLNSFYDDIIPREREPVNEIQASSDFGTFDDYSEFSTILPPYA